METFILALYLLLMATAIVNSVHCFALAYKLKRARTDEQIIGTLREAAEKEKLFFIFSPIRHAARMDSNLKEWLKENKII